MVPVRYNGTVRPGRNTKHRAQCARVALASSSSTGDSQCEHILLDMAGSTRGNSCKALLTRKEHVLRNACWHITGCCLTSRRQCATLQLRQPLPELATAAAVAIRRATCWRSICRHLLSYGVMRCVYGGAAAWIVFALCVVLCRVCHQWRHCQV